MNLVIIALAYFVHLSVMSLLRLSVYRQKNLKYVLKRVLKTIRYEFSFSSGLICPFVCGEPFATECV
jgi:hypothetical protein